MTSLLVTDIAELVTNDPQAQDLLGVRQNAALLVEDGTVACIGDTGQAPAADEAVSAAGRAVIPGFVDSHNHLIFAGDRSEEFAARMAGQAYSAGGIATTVSATREASAQQLEDNLVRLLRQAEHSGTTTCELSLIHI